MNAPRIALPPEAAAAVVPRPASTTLLVRDGAEGIEVLMVRRALNVAFMPGSYVFPGGAVDDADGSAESLARCDETPSQLAARLGSGAGLGEAAAAHAVAALRECFEECGLWLGPAGDELPAMPWPVLRARLHAGQPMHSIAAAAGRLLRTSVLQPWSRWLTPVGLPRRFDTFFLVAPAPEGQAPTPDAGETTTLAWVQPARALAAHHEGLFPMEFATVRTVESLQPFANAAALLRHAASPRELPLIAPRLHLDAERRILGAILPGEEVPRPG